MTFQRCWMFVLGDSCATHHWLLRLLKRCYQRCDQGHCLMRLTILDLLQSLRTMAGKLSGSVGDTERVFALGGMHKLFAFEWKWKAAQAVPPFRQVYFYFTKEDTLCLHMVCCPQTFSPVLVLANVWLTANLWGQYWDENSGKRNVYETYTKRIRKVMWIPFTLKLSSCFALFQFHSGINKVWWKQMHATFWHTYQSFEVPRPDILDRFSILLAQFFPFVVFG